MILAMWRKGEREKESERERKGERERYIDREGGGTLLKRKKSI